MTIFNYSDSKTFKFFVLLNGLCTLVPMMVFEPPGSDVPGLPPNANRGPMLIRAMWSMNGVAITIVILRFYTQLKVIRKLSLADYLMVVALVGRTDVR